MATDDLHYCTLTEVSELLVARKVSPVDLTRLMFKRIEKVDRNLHSFAYVSVDSGLAQASRAEAEIFRGEHRGPLHGVPIAVKDLCFTKSFPTAAGTKFLAEWKPDYDATVVERLEEAGAVLLGKLQMTEGASAEHHPDLRAPVNPWNADSWPGASSSGAGVATAAGLCFGAIASDTGGSIRFPQQPAGLPESNPPGVALAVMVYFRCLSRLIILARWLAAHRMLPRSWESSPVPTKKTRQRCLLRCRITVEAYGDARE